MSTIITLGIPLPPQLIAMNLIGVKGAIVKNIIYQSGVAVLAPPERPVDINGMRLVELSGSVQSVFSSIAVIAQTLPAIFQALQFSNFLGDTANTPITVFLQHVPNVLVGQYVTWVNATDPARMGKGANIAWLKAQSKVSGWNQKPCGHKHNHIEITGLPAHVLHCILLMHFQTPVDNICMFIPREVPAAGMQALVEQMQQVVVHVHDAVHHPHADNNNNDDDDDDDDDDDEAEKRPGIRLRMGPHQHFHVLAAGALLPSRAELQAEVKAQMVKWKVTASVGTKLLLHTAVDGNLGTLLTDENAPALLAPALQAPLLVLVHFPIECSKPACKFDVACFYTHPAVAAKAKIVKAKVAKKDELLPKAIAGVAEVAVVHHHPVVVHHPHAAPPPPSSTYDVFISYRRNDAASTALAMQLRDYLTGAPGVAPLQVYCDNDGSPHAQELINASCRALPRSKVVIPMLAYYPATSEGALAQMMAWEQRRLNPPAVPAAVAMFPDPCDRTLLEWGLALEVFAAKPPATLLKKILPLLVGVPAMLAMSKLSPVAHGPTASAMQPTLVELGIHVAAPKPVKTVVTEISKTAGKLVGDVRVLTQEQLADIRARVAEWL